MSTHNICFCGEIQKNSAIFRHKKHLIWSYGNVVMFIHTAIWCNETSQFLKTFFDTTRSKKSYTKYPGKENRNWRMTDKKTNKLNDKNMSYLYLLPHNDGLMFYIPFKIIYFILRCRGDNIRLCVMESRTVRHKLKTGSSGFEPGTLEQSWNVINLPYCT